MSGTSAAPTLAQVAKLAGVSLKTASRVFNGEPYVAQKTTERVQQAAAMLGFRPNRIARELRRGSRSTLIGMIIGDLMNPFYAQVASVVERELRPAGYQVITATTDADPAAEQRLVDDLLERRVAALVIVSSAGAHQYLTSVAATGVPIVFLDRPYTGVTADAVMMDDRAGGRMAVQHLLDHGHERIAIVGDRAQLGTYRERLVGFTEALAAADGIAWETHLRDEPHTVRSAKNVVAAIMSHGLPPTAVLTTSGVISMGAISAFQRLHRSAALLGFDDFDLADVLKVSVVSHDVARLAREGARLVLDRIGGDESAPRTVVLGYRLIDRGSAAGYALV